LINNLPEETITILTSDSNQKSIPNQMLRKILIENANKFNMNTYNFNQINFNNINFHIGENEILVLLNKNVFEVNEEILKRENSCKLKSKINDICEQEVEIQFEKYFPSIQKFYELNKDLTIEDKINFENSEDEDHIILLDEMKHKKYDLEKDYLISLRIKFNIKAEKDNNQIYLKENFSFFSSLLKNLIYLDEYNNINLNKREINFSKFILRSNYTDNIDIAIFNKMNYFNNKNKILIFYLNQNNLIGEKSKITFEDIQKQLKSLINMLKNQFPEIKFLVTSNPSIFNLFNLLPSDKENISIRFLDYSKLIYFENKKENCYKFINYEKNSDLSQLISKLDRNLIFNYKTNFARYQDALNSENLKNFISDSINLDSNNSDNNRIGPYLESAESSKIFFDQFKKNINILTAENFKAEILGNKYLHKSLILLYNQDCNGCKKIESLVNDMLDESKSYNNIKVFRYNTLNENIHFKKYRNVPAAVLFENGKIFKEIDLKKIIDENENHDAALIDVLGDLLKENEKKHY
jgi:hypothetical protein